MLHDEINRAVADIRVGDPNRAVLRRRRIVRIESRNRPPPKREVVDKFGSKFAWPAPGTARQSASPRISRNLFQSAIDLVSIGDRNATAADRFDHRGKLPLAIGIRDPSIVELRQLAGSGLLARTSPRMVLLTSILALLIEFAKTSRGIGGNSRCLPHTFNDCNHESRQPGQNRSRRLARELIQPPMPKHESWRLHRQSLRQRQISRGNLAPPSEQLMMNIDLHRQTSVQERTSCMRAADWRISSCRGRRQNRTIGRARRFVTVPAAAAIYRACVHARPATNAIQRAAKFIAPQIPLRPLSPHDVQFAARQRAVIIYE